MGKKTIETFIYNGACDYYLRIPLTQPKGIRGTYSPQYFWTEYMPKNQFTLRQALERRLEMVKEAEKKGLRKTSAGTGFACRVKTSAHFEKEEADGLYDKYK